MMVPPSNVETGHGEAPEAGDQQVVVFDDDDNDDEIVVDRYGGGADANRAPVGAANTSDRAGGPSDPSSRPWPGPTWDYPEVDGGCSDALSALVCKRMCGARQIGRMFVLRERRAPADGAPPERAGRQFVWVAGPWWPMPVMILQRTFVD